MTKLALGTAQFGQEYGISNFSGPIKRSEVLEILKSAQEQKIDLIDTAITYGESENILGDIGVSNFNVVTKLPSCPTNSADLVSWVKNHVKASLKRLGLKSIYGLLLHRSENLIGTSGIKIKDALYHLKSEGLVKKIGVSIYNPEELEGIIKKIKIDLVQAPLNLIDQRLQTSGWLSRLHNEGIEIHSRSSFLQGLLLLSRKQIPNKFERWNNIWDQWENEKNKSGKSALELCLAYPFSFPEVDKVIVGVNNIKHLNAIILASKNTFEFNECSFMKSDDQLLINPLYWENL
jgi:aryl-alcohol dehydrogenase-like predicted oxidoreductase